MTASLCQLLLDTFSENWHSQLILSLSAVVFKKTLSSSNFYSWVLAQLCLSQKICFILRVNCSDFYVKYNKCYGCLLCLGASSFWKFPAAQREKLLSPWDHCLSDRGKWFWLQLYFGNFLLNADKFLLPSQPRLKLYLLISVSSTTNFTFTHSPSLSHSRTFFSQFGFKTILEILHMEVSLSVLKTLRSK